MFPAWRLQLREARIAVADGRWDEAAATLANQRLRQFLPAKRLSQELAGRLVTRARQRITGGESSAGWRDLEQAAQLGASEKEISELRDSQVSRRLERVAQLVLAGELAAADDELARMRQRGLKYRPQVAWQATVERAARAERLAHRGEFSAAVDALARAMDNLPANAEQVRMRLEHQRSEMQSRHKQSQESTRELYTAVAAADWPAALQAADALLELAPGHAAARQARRKAWKALGMATTELFRGVAPQQSASLEHRERVGRLAASTRARSRSIETDTVTNSPEQGAREQGQRLVAWIDAVGGYLICLGDEVVLGRPDPAGRVDVPIQADLSRRHAVVCREGESYLLTPVGRVSVDGVVATGPTVLRDGAEIQLGEAVRMRFRRPHALSTTAVLSIETNHKTKPAVDGVVLMSESCILGPKSHSHIPCRDWEDDLVLFRHGDELRCRATRPVEVDGEPGVEQAAVAKNCRIEGDQFSLSFEEI